MILLAKMLIAMTLMVGSFGWALIIRLAGDETSNLPLHGIAFFLGAGIVVGTLWQDES